MIIYNIVMIYMNWIFPSYINQVMQRPPVFITLHLNLSSSLSSSLSLNPSLSLSLSRRLEPGQVRTSPLPGEAEVFSSSSSLG